MSKRRAEMYRNISIKTELADTVEHWVKGNPEYGFRSIAQFMEDAARKRLEELKAIGPHVPPRFERINHDENGVKILDRNLRDAVQIFFRPHGILCDYCQKSDCAHVQFALADVEVRKQVQKKRKEGWKLPEV